jgi:hypothetical protein
VHQPVEAAIALLQRLGQLIVVARERSLEIQRRDAGLGLLERGDARWTCSSFETVRPISTSSAPCAAALSASARPMPSPAPVIAITRPCSASAGRLEALMRR